MKNEPPKPCSKKKDYNQKLKARAKREAEGNNTGRKPKPPGTVKEIGQASTEQCKLTDPDAWIMRKNPPKNEAIQITGVNRIDPCK